MYEACDLFAIFFVSLVFGFLALFHFVFGIINAQALDFVLYRHDRMLEKHPPLGAAHDFTKFFCLLLAEARDFTALADQLRDSVRTTIDLQPYGRQQSGAFWTEGFATRRFVMTLTVYGKGLANMIFFFRNSIFYFYWFFLWQKS